MEVLKDYTIEWELELGEICDEIGNAVSARKDKMPTQTFDAYVEAFGKIHNAMLMLMKISKEFEASQV